MKEVVKRQSCGDGAQPILPPTSESSGQRVYVASRASLPARPAMWRQYRADGWPIISTWIDEAEAGQTDDLGELWTRIQREVTTATALIFYAEGEDVPLKGAYIEVGMALAAGVPVLVVTPDLKLTAPSYRPIGSWVCHSLVTFHRSPDAALRAATASPLGGPIQTLEEPIPSSPPCGMGPSDLDAGLGAEPHGPDACCSAANANGPPWAKNRLRKLLCRFAGHAFVEFSDGFKRRCRNCNREEWVFSKPYPLIGQPKYFWSHMNYEGLRGRK